MLRAEYKKYDLRFRFPAGTSRGILTMKPSWLIKIWNEKNPDVIGIGECSIIPGLNMETPEMIEELLNDVCKSSEKYTLLPEELLLTAPSVRFGLETAFTDLKNGGQRILYPSDFISGKGNIRINGLVWMGNPEFMKKQIREKIEKGFRCIKIKIGPLDFSTELELLNFIRTEFKSESIEIRLDANGSFQSDEAEEKLKQLSEFHIHSIEQPLKPGNVEALSDLCRKNIIPVALDEELIGINGNQKCKELLNQIRPQYIILKPSLLGGFAYCLEWIRLAGEINCGWWITSALESNIGLNAIAQWTYTLHNDFPQGLGTGNLYENNFESPLYLSGETLCYNPNIKWNLNQFNQ